MEKSSVFQPWKVSLKINNTSFLDKDTELEVLIEDKERCTAKGDSFKLELKFCLTEDGVVEATLEGIGIIIRQAMEPRFVFDRFLSEKKEFFPDYVS